MCPKVFSFLRGIAAEARGLTLSQPLADSSFCGRSLEDFASAEETKGLSDRPLETFGHPADKLVSDLKRMGLSSVSLWLTAPSAEGA